MRGSAEFGLEGVGVGDRERGVERGVEEGWRICATSSASAAPLAYVGL